LPSYSVRLLPVILPVNSLALPPQYRALLLSLFLAVIAITPLITAVRGEYPTT
jgi:hypothetical protein